MKVVRKGPVPSHAVDASIDLYWLPLGAGGHFVRFNGRVYEAIHARFERRRPLDLYHSALEVRVPEGRFVIENSWPIPDANGAARGVAVEGPVGSRRLARFHVFRYEIRRWREGVIADVGEAVASPQRLSDDHALAHRLLELVASVPALVWGRDELDVGEMWNSNSVISWLLARSGLPTEEIHPPTGGRAPGWAAGLRLAHLSRHQGRGIRSPREKLGETSERKGRDFGEIRLTESDFYRRAAPAPVTARSDCGDRTPAASSTRSSARDL